MTSKLITRSILSRALLTGAVIWSAGELAAAEPDANRLAAPSPIAGWSDQPFGWIPSTPLPGGRARYALAQSGQHFYVIAGATSGARVANTTRFDAVTGDWTELAPVPVASEAPAAAYYNGKIYFADGGGGANLIRIYDVDTNTWSAGPPRTDVENSYGAAAGAYNGKVYLVGGNPSASASVGVYNVATNAWSTGPSAPGPVYLAGYKQIGRFLYVVGGYTNSTQVNSHTTMRLDMATETWSAGPSFVPGKADFALAASGFRLFAIGGDADGGGFFDATATVHELDTNNWPSGSWAASPAELPSPRQAYHAGFSSSAEAGGEIWSTGGFLLPSGSVTGMFFDEHLYRAERSCEDYAVAAGTAAIVPGTTDVGNHCDNCTTTVALPFAVTIYDRSFTSVRVDSNGKLLFGTGGSSTPSNTTLPNVGVDYAIFAFWDDLRTDTAASGIFTSVSGAAPTRVFNIEWRATTAATGEPVNFVVRLFENSWNFEVIYGASSGAATGTIGVQRDIGSLSTQWRGPVASPPAPGTRLSFSLGCAPFLQHIASRKNQGVAFDLPMPFFGSRAIEPRSSGNTHQIVFGFAAPVTVANAVVTSSNGLATISDTLVSDRTITVNLQNVTNAQTISVTLQDVTDGTTTRNVSVPLGVLAGDVNGNGSVTATDVAQVKSQTSQPITSLNFRSDVTPNGAINASDIGLVKSRSGTTLP